MTVSMKLRVLEEFLQGLDGFEKPKVLLEQYATPSHIASCMIHTMQASFEDIEGKAVCDLGAGCGMLTCGAALLQASQVVAFEIDPDALDVFSQNMNDMDITNVDAVLGNIFSGFTERFHKKFDTVVLNPPFGTKKNAGIDLEFLKKAQDLSTYSIYSLHKTSTRRHIQKKTKEWGLKSEVVAQLHYDLPSSYKFHKKSSVDIEVDFWRFEVQEEK